MKIGIVGTGNAAYHFGKMLTERGHIIAQIFSRKGDAEFAKSFGAASISNTMQFKDDMDIILLAVSDSAIESVSKTISIELPVVHLSGAVSIHALQQTKRGVIWPIFSLSKNNAIDYASIPFLIEASDKELEKTITKIIGADDLKVHLSNDEVRKKAHLAAVFANNFVNHLYDISDQLLRHEGMDIQLLLPLISAQLEKIKEMNPHEAQTGPAARGDYNTIREHLALLEDQPALQVIYSTITNSIIETFHGKKL